MTKKWIGIGHRGSPGEFPGNTMSGFQRAFELGCEMVECDVRQASDGVLVLAHDEYVHDSAGRRFLVAEHTSSALAALDLGKGEGVPTLLELASWAQGRCGVMADMKCEGNGVEAEVAAALAPLPTASKIVPGAVLPSRCRFRELDPTLPLSLSLGAREGRDLLAGDGFRRLLEQIDTDAVTWEYPLLDRPRIEALHARGLRVYVWTVDDPAIMRRLIDDGVDGLISNRPDLLADLY